MAPFKSKLSLENFDYCSICNKQNVILCCDKCGDAVCDNKNCRTTFPQYNKDDYVLCKHCIISIEQKLRIWKEHEPEHEPVIYTASYH